MATRTRRFWSGSLALLIALGVPTTLVATTTSASAAATAASRCSVTNTTTGVTFANLQKAITRAPAGTILRITGTCVGSYTIGKPLTLQKGGTTAVLKGNGSTVLTVTGGPVRLIGLRITGGTASVCPAYTDWVCGGGISNTGTLTLTNTTVAGNTAAGGATRSALGGGIYNDAVASLTLTRSTVSGNAVSSGLLEADGAGIDNEGVLRVVKSTISGNSSTSAVHGYGGGIFDYLDTTLIVTASTISGNTISAPGKAQGGGIFIADGLVALTNSTVSGNSVAGGDNESLGGGIYDASTTFTVTSSTIAANRAIGFGGMGGGIYSDGTPGVGSTIIAGNSSDMGRDCTITPAASSLGNNLIGSGASCLAFQNGVNHDLVGTNASPVNARLAPLAANGGPTLTRALKAGSPAINAAGIAPCDTSKDQRGVTRPRGSACDIGAFEKQ